MVHAEFRRPAFLPAVLLAIAGAAPLRACMDIPATPGGLACPARTRSSVVLRWNPVVSRDNCVITYTVFLDGALAASGLARPEATLTGLAADAAYRVSVAAVNPMGSSAPSPAIQVRTLPLSPFGTPLGVPAGHGMRRAFSTLAIRTE